MHSSACLFTRRTLLVPALLLASSSLFAQQQQYDSTDHRATEIYSPVPPIVNPAEKVGNAPSDAVVLFDGQNEDQWVKVSDGSAADWIVADGILTVNKHSGNIQTKQAFSNYQLHLEFRIPANITGSDQARGNSGLFLASTGKGDDGYEMQILDNYNNKTYTNGQVGSVYKQRSKSVV